MVILCLGIIFPLWVNLLLLAGPLKSNGCSIMLTFIVTAYSAVHGDWYQINHKQSGGKKPSKPDTIPNSRSKGLVTGCPRSYSWNQAKTNRSFYLMTFTQCLGKNTRNNLSTSESTSALTASNVHLMDSHSMFTKFQWVVLQGSTEHGKPAVLALLTVAFSTTIMQHPYFLRRWEQLITDKLFKRYHLFYILLRWRQYWFTVWV